MSKASHIRKKALEYARSREWDKAIKEYLRLAELEANNPNVFNELGDLYLKVGSRPEAFKSYFAAIDAYDRVSFFNNAVAVCKKLLRLDPRQQEVYAKLGKLRKHQGFQKEAVTYYLTYLDRVVQDSSLDPEELKEKVCEAANEMDDVPEVLEKVVDYLLKWEFSKEAGGVLSKLHKIYHAMGLSAECDKVKKKMTAVGYQPTAPESAGSVKREESGVEEDWAAGRPKPGQPPRSKTGVPGEHGQKGAKPAAARPQGSRTANAPFDFGNLDIDEESDAKSRGSATQTITEKQKSPSSPGRQTSGGRGGGEAVGGGPPNRLSEEEVWIPKEDLPDSLSSGAPGGDGEVVHLSDIVEQFKSEVTANIDEEDYRSHYDLGMAYLEMDLLPEAIREFQFAAKSSMYQVRSLEMIGLCFLKQKQPNLAIKQLKKGLELVGDDERETLGLRYNLGLAYEMTGEMDKAKSCFEDVYVVDVTFRDVEDKIKNHAS